MSLNNINKKKNNIKKSESEIIIVHKWEGEENSRDFIARVKVGNEEYIGIVDSDLVKQGYGLLSLPNNEKYFGYFTDNLKSRHGIYQFPDRLVGEKIEREFFYGLFNEGKIYHHGVYLSIKENKNVEMFNNFDQADFSCFIGDLDLDLYHFTKGTLMVKEGDKYYMYHGKFNDNNEKEGDGVFYYNSEKDELIYGKAVKDKFVEGYMSIFDEDGNISNGVYAIFNDKGKIKQYKKMEEIEDKNKIFDKMFDFRNKIMEKDYFGQIFEIFKDTMKTVNNEVNLESLNSKVAFSELINITYNFNKIKIKDEIEGVLAKYE